MSEEVYFNDINMNGRKLKSMAAASGNGEAVRYEEFVAGSTFDRNRANHTGSQTVSTISDFNTGVRLNRLDQMAAPAGLVFMNSQRITALADPTGSQDGATKNYVDNALAGLAAGMVLKGSAVSVSKINVNIASPGADIGGAFPAVGKRVVLMAQSTPANNGPYIFNGASVPLTRDPAWDTAAEMTLGSYWVVLDGYDRDQFVMFINDTAPTVGTTALDFIAFGGLPSYTAKAQLLYVDAITAGGSLDLWATSFNTITSLTLKISAGNVNAGHVVHMAHDLSNNQVTLRPDVGVAAGYLDAFVMGY